MGIAHLDPFPAFAHISVFPKHNGERVNKNYKEASHRPWDATIICSGMGGMSCAAALSKYGQKVLLLLQHYIPSGFEDNQKSWGEVDKMGRSLV